MTNNRVFKETGLKAFFALTFCMTAIYMAPTPVAGQASEEEWSVEKELVKARAKKMKSDTLESSLLGTLPTAAEYAAAQPNLRKMYTSVAPLLPTYDEQKQHEAKRDYSHNTFFRSSRVGAILPLGPTGAYFRDMDTRHELVVIKIKEDTPADGLLKVDDIILGANGRMFLKDMDPRPPMGYAIYESQTEKLGGTLTLHLVREGKPMNVQIPLKVQPEYSKNWPYDCERSRQITDKATEFILENARHKGLGWWCSLYLMGTGDQRGLEVVRRSLSRGFQKAPKGDFDMEDRYKMRSWGLAYTLVIACEYYLQTGDSNALPLIEYNRKVLEFGQSRAGGWGHSCPCSGYGEVNSVGSIAFMGLALARECGIDVEEEKLAKSIRFFGRYIGGGMPYGNHPSGGRGGKSANGKGAQGVVAFKCLGEDEIAKQWARTTCYMWMGREAGHAERIFNFTWGPLASSLASPDEFGMYMNNLMWYYELGRTHEGSLTYLGSGKWGSPLHHTGAIGLAYVQARKKLYIMGASKSVFAKTPPNAELQKAADLYKAKDWKGVKKLLTAYTADTSKPDQDYAKELLAAYNRMEEHVAATLDIIKESIKKGDAEFAMTQLESLEYMLQLKEKRADIEAVRASFPKVFREVATVKTQPLESESKRFAFDTLNPPIYDWEFVLPTAKEAMLSQKETYKVYVAKAESTPNMGRWYANDYNASKWLTHRGAIPVTRSRQVWIRRTFRTMGKPEVYKYLDILPENCEGEVYLNGYKLADIKDGEVLLAQISVKSLAKGENVFAAHLRPTSDREPLDIGLRAGPPVFKDNIDDPFGGDL